MHLQTIMHIFKNINLHVYACTHVKNNSLTCCLRMHAHIARPRIVHLLFFFCSANAPKTKHVTLASPKCATKTT